MTRRDRLMLLGVALVALVVSGWFLALAPMRKESKDLAGQIATQQETIDSVHAEIAAGIAAKRAYARDYATVARLGAAIPEDDNVASLIVQLQQASDASGIDFRTLRVNASSGAATPAPTPPAATTTGAPATQISVATLPPGAAVGSAGFPTMPFSFSFTGSFFHLSDFVGQIQDYLVVGGDKLRVGGRFMTLDGIALTAAADGFPHMKVAVAATSYLLPADQGLTAGATASGPATGASAGTPGSSETASTTVPGGTATATPLVR
jgi:Tfp pilus assembly protein PilO